MTESLRLGLDTMTHSMDLIEKCYLHHMIKASASDPIAEAGAPCSGYQQEMGPQNGQPLQKHQSHLCRGHEPPNCLVAFTTAAFPLVFLIAAVSHMPHLGTAQTAM